MSEKTITIPFSYSEFLRSRKIIWSVSIKKALKSYIIYSIIPLALLASGFLFDDVFSKIVGLALLFYMLSKWSDLYMRRKKYFEKVKIIGGRYEHESLEYTFIFSQDEIEYYDKEKLYRLKWSLFNPYSVYNDTILLKAKDTDMIMFALSKNEIGEADYREVCDILKEKTFIK